MNADPKMLDLQKRLNELMVESAQNGHLYIPKILRDQMESGENEDISVSAAKYVLENRESIIKNLKMAVEKANAKN